MLQTRRHPGARASRPLLLKAGKMPELPATCLFRKCAPRIPSAREIFFACLVAGYFTPFAIPPARAGESNAAQPVEAFDRARADGRNPEAISHWRWTKEEKRGAKDFSRLEICDGGGANGGALKVSIFNPLPRGGDFYGIWTTGLDCLPPEAVAVRMRARAVAGNFTLTVGSATAYFADSDVWARTQVIEPGGWRTLEFSLVSDLQRNFRRAVFSAEAPEIHYTRWIQEPMRIMVGADSRGELWIDDVELVLSGRETSPPDQRQKKLHQLAAADLGRAFTFSTDDKEFDLARTPGKTAVRKPAVLNVPKSSDGMLVARQRGLEEMSFIGIPLTCPEGTNALRVTMKTAHASRLENLAVDFLAIISPGGIFPWTKLPAGEPGGFDFCLSPARTKGTSWGFYHARRIVPNGEQVAIVIPFGEFLCAYGTGELRARQQLQQPIAPGEVVAIALVSPFRQAAADTLFTIQSIEALRLED